MTGREGERAPIFYTAVAGYLLENFAQWRTHTRDVNQVSVTYTAQFFDLCRALGRPGVASGIAPAAAQVSGDGMTVIVRPYARDGRGLRYHLQMVARACANVRDINRSGASDVIMMDGAGYWFPLIGARRKGRRFFLSVHTVLWRAQPSRLRKTVLAAEGWFIRKHCAGVLAVSNAIADQVRQLAGPAGPPISVFHPVYLAEDFAGMPPADAGARPFEILYAGRIEEAKGVFDLVEVAQLLIARGFPDFQITLCGDGSALPALRAAISTAGLDPHIACLGYQERDAMIAHLARAQCVVVPTRSTFPEGFNKVVIEAVLAGRPVVTSAVCPALDEVRPAAIEAEVDNPASYADAIEALMSDAALFAGKVAASAALRARFTDTRSGWLAQTEALLCGKDGR